VNKMKNKTIEIEITGNETLIIDKKFDYLLCRSIFRTKSGGGYHYPCFWNGPKKILLHNFIMEEHLGRPLAQGECVDHINFNTMDNRVSNLRIITKSQNSLNTTSSGRSNTGIRGIKKISDNNYKVTFQINKNKYNFTAKSLESAIEIRIGFLKQLGKVPESTLEKIGE